MNGLSSIEIISHSHRNKTNEHNESHKTLTKCFNVFLWLLVSSLRFYDVQRITKLAERFPAKLRNFYVSVARRRKHETQQRRNIIQTSVCKNINNRLVNY